MLKFEKYQTRLASPSKRYTRLLDNMVEGCQIIGFDWKYLYVNEAAAKHGNQPRKKLLGASVEELYPGIEHTDVFNAMHRCMKQKEKHIIENEFKYPDGSKRWFSLTIQPDPEGIFITSIDITDRKQVENSLRKSEKRYRSLFEFMEEGFLRADTNGKIIMANRSIAKMFGYESSEEMIGLHMTSFYVNPDDREKMIRIVQNKGVVYDYEILLKTKDGHSFWSSNNIKVIKDEFGNRTGTEGLIRDVTDRKKMELALKQSEERLKLAFESVSDAVWDWRIDTDDVYFNSHWYTLLGYEPNELPQAYDTWKSLLHPDDLLTAEQIIHKHLKLDIPFAMEFRMKTKDSKWKWLLGRGKTVERDLNGNAVRMIGTHMDISVQKQIMAELQFQSQIMNAVENAVIVTDQDGYIVYWNPSAETIYGWSSEDAVGKTSIELIAADASKQLGLEIIEQLRGGNSWSGEYLVRNRDGREFPVHSSITPVHKSDGQLYFIGISFDISEQKKAENALRESEKLFKHFFEHLMIGVAIYESVDDGEDFIFTDMNPAGQRLSKVSIEDIRGKSLTQVFPGVRDLGLFKALQDSWRTGKPHHVPFHQYKDTRIMQWVENRVFRLPSGKIVAVYDDRTEIMQLEEELHRTQKIEAIGTLAGGIAHDFNNLLSVLMGNISYVISDLNKDGELFKILNDALEATNQAKYLTHQLLTFAKGGEPIKEPNNINKILEKSAKFVTSGAKSRCAFDLADDLWIAEVDSGQLTQVISNIVINADQAMQNGGIITIRSENAQVIANNELQLPDGRYVKISIEDQGNGIYDKHLQKIFDPYFTTKQKGRGLGLATSYSIVKRHAGQISVHSETGKGTIFNIYLPASSVRGQNAAKNEEPKYEGHGRILIMDDQESILEMAERMFGKMGYETKSATDGAKAIELYRESYYIGKPFDLVILDLTVPGGMGGARTIQELLKINPKVKAVVSSGYSNDPVMANYEDYGFSGVMPKPYTKKQLSEILHKIKTTPGI